MYRKIKRSWK